MDFEQINDKMKQKLILIFSVMLLCSCASRRSGWKLVWTENFKGKTIDTESWTRVKKGTSDWDDMMSPRPDLAYIEDGQLVLLGKPGDSANGDETPFVTGGVHSAGKKSFRMARYEVKAKFNSVNGFWPALWLMPDSKMRDNDYAEVDLMEHLNHEDKMYQTLHSRYTLSGGKDIPQSAASPIKKDEWNVYAAEIWPDSICLFVNDSLTLTYPRVEGKDKQFPWPDYPFYFILSNQIGGTWVGPVNKPEELPSELRVDWVKVYQRKE